MNDQERMTSAAGAVGGATLISRVLGFVRDMIIAQIFGTKMAADAFFVAFRIPNLLRRLLGEGSLTAAVVPVFTEYLTTKDREEAWKLANILLNTFLVILFVTVILGIVSSPVIVRFIAPGFHASAQKFDLTVELTAFMFPYLFFVGMAALTMGMLNSLRVFFIPALGPVFLNISMILAAIFLAPRLEQPVFALAAGVIVGGVLQFFIQVPALIKKGLKYKPTLDFAHPGLIKIGKLMLPSLVGLAVMEINIFVDTLLASLLPEGSVSYLYYGNRLVQFPQGIFAVALGVAILPTLSQQAAKNQMEELKDTVSFGIRLVLFITIPATVGLIVLKGPIINLLFERGEFTHQSTLATAHALFYYAIGLCAFSGVKVIVPAFYSLKDTVSPVKVAVLAMITNIVLNLLLMGPLQHGGLALATSLSSLLNVTLLIFILRKKIGSIKGRTILISVVKLTLASIVMGFLIYWINTGFYDMGANVLLKAGVLFGNIALGIIFYFILSFFLKVEEGKFLINLLKNKLT
ncbi:MAG: murein biosynthesis integral membrane protein MurJ [Nitrospinota bacterium]|nr:murein biosynthesis integral membrane protein MurJ [Nitrospinota bacterium]